MEDKQIVKKEEKEEKFLVRDMATDPVNVNRFAEILGGKEKANQFLVNVITAVRSNSSLMKCEPNAVMACAMTAAALNLDVVPGLGFAAIVPYNKSKLVGKEWVQYPVPQFQIMKNGFVQLAMRSGQVKTINVTDIYKDELVSYDRLSGEIKIKEVPNGQREKGNEADIAGYACFVRLTNGFEKTEYWPIEKIEKHALRYSQAYQYDKNYNKKNSPWSTNFPAMAEKTVIKATISKWIPMSTQMLLAQQADQSSVRNFSINNGKYEGDFEYVDNKKEATPTEEKKSFNEKYGIKETSIKKENKVPNSEQNSKPEEFEDDFPFEPTNESNSEGLF